MSCETVQTAKAERILVVTIQRPERRNAVDPPTARALHEAFVDFDRDPDLDVAILTGGAEAFCSGFDLATVADGSAMTWLEQLHFGKAGAPPLGPMGPTRLILDKPVIAAIAGPAVAGGMELALWCDLRIMERSAYMGVFCRRFGVPLIDGGTVRLPALIGQARAMELILTGRRIDSAECEAVGLCNTVVDTGAALDAAVGLARNMAAFPPVCLRADRRSALGDPASLREALEREFAGGRDALAVEARKGAQAFGAGAGRHGQGVS